MTFEEFLNQIKTELPKLSVSPGVNFPSTVFSASVEFDPLDRTVVGDIFYEFSLPDEIRWHFNPNGTNLSRRSYGKTPGEAVKNWLALRIKDGEQMILNAKIYQSFLGF